MPIIWVWSHNVQKFLLFFWNWLSTRYFRNIPFCNLLSPLQSALQQHQHQQYLLSKYLQLFAKVLYFVTSWHKKLRVFDKFFGHVFTSFCSVVYDLIILAEERTFHSAPSVLWTTIPWEEIKSNLFEILFVAHKVFFCDFRQAVLKKTNQTHLQERNDIQVWISTLGVCELLSRLLSWVLWGWKP